VSRGESLVLKRSLLVVVLALAPIVFPLHSTPTPPGTAVPAGFKSPLGLAVDHRGERAYVALHTAGVLAEIDLGTGKVLRETAVGEQPEDVVRLQDAIFVALAGGELVLVDPERLTVRRRMAQKDAPAPVLRRLGEHRLEAREADFLLGRGEATNVRARLEHGDQVFLVHQRPRHHVPATQVSQGWVFLNAIGLAVNVPAAHALLDEPQRGHADPSDLAITPDGAHLFVACAGADVVLVLDRQALLRVSGFEDRSYADSSRVRRDDLTTSRHYLVARLPTQANPRRLALSGNGKVLVASNHLADSLTVIDAVRWKVLRHIPLGGPPPDAVRRGEILFHSARLTFQNQFTCASCHPGGGADGLTWDLERDGVGSFKRTKSLLGVKDTAPYGWHGTSPTLADRVAGTLRSLHRHEPAGTEVDDLVAYLESLPPPRGKEGHRPVVERGRALFQGKGLCSNCHHRSGLDDGKTHDVGTRGPGDTQDRFDTPSLRGVWAARSFLHDGRAATLEEVFTKHNPRQRHGAAHLLSKEELADLIVYLNSL
jgi:cytochrome c peroxidase